MLDGWIYTDATNPKPFLPKVWTFTTYQMWEFSLCLTWAFYSLGPLISKYGAAMQSMGCHQIIENWSFMKHVPTFQFCITFWSFEPPSLLGRMGGWMKNIQIENTWAFWRLGLSSTTLKYDPHSDEPIYVLVKAPSLLLNLELRATSHTSHGHEIVRAQKKVFKRRPKYTSKVM